MSVVDERSMIVVELDEELGVNRGRESRPKRARRELVSLNPNLHLCFWHSQRGGDTSI